MFYNHLIFSKVTLSLRICLKYLVFHCETNRFPVGNNLFHGGERLVSPEETSVSIRGNYCFHQGKPKFLLNETFVVFYAGLIILLISASVPQNGPCVCSLMVHMAAAKQPASR